MLRKLFPLFLALVGFGVGGGAGLLLRPSPAVEDITEGTPANGEQAKDISDERVEEGPPEYVKMNNQFVVPVVQSSRVVAMVVLSLSLEVAVGNTEAVYQREPKLRDVFLQVLFDHANTGGFGGSFTDGSNLVVLRNNLKEAAALVIGDVVSDVLITDIARQDN